MSLSISRLARGVLAFALLVTLVTALGRAAAAPGDITWTVGTAVPTARVGLGLASTGTRLYAVGGRQTTGAASNLTSELNLATGVWTARAVLPTPRYDLAAAATPNGRVYAAGGCCAAGTTPASLFHELNTSVANPAWVARAPLPTPRRGLALVATPSGKLYAMGGNDGVADLTTVDEYDPSTDSWRSRRPMSVARSLLGVAVEQAPGGGTYIYAVGGSSGGIPVAALERYDVDLDSWESLANMPTARGSIGVTVAGRDGDSQRPTLYSVGGDDGAVALDVIEQYDLQNDVWTTAANPFPGPRRGHGMASATNGRVYVVGGASCLTATCAVSTTYEGAVELPVLSNWTMFQRDQRHTGLSTLSAPGANGGTVAELMRLSLGTGPIVTQPLIGPDLTIYVGAGTHLHAIYSYGASKWRFPVGSEVGALAMSGDGTLYVTGVSAGQATLFALDATGVERWRFDAATGDDPPRSLAVGRDGTVYVGISNAAGTGATLYALDPSGQERWATDVGYLAGSSPAIGVDGSIWIGSYDADGVLYVIEADGTLRGSTEPIGAVNSSPSIGDDGTVYVGTSRGLYAITPQALVRWRVPTSSPINYSSPAIGADGTVYVGADGDLFAVDPDGVVRWRTSCLPGGRINSSPAIGADGLVLVQAISPGSAMSAAVCAFDASGRRTWSYQTEIGGENGPLVSSPSIGEQELAYVGTSTGTLYALYTAPTGVVRTNRIVVPFVPR